MVEFIKLAIPFVSGIYLSERVAPSFAVIFFLSLILVLTFKAIFKHKFDIKILILVFAFVSGVVMCRGSLSAERNELADYTGRYVTITGRVSELPREAGENIRYVIDARTISYKGEARDIKENILMTAPEQYSYGDTVTFSGFVDPLPDKMNENGFDYARYYKSKNIFFKIYSSRPTKAAIKIRVFSPEAAGKRLKCAASDIIDKRYSGDYAAILKAVLTGNKSEFSDEFNAVLERTGLGRFYYPAFLHVMLYMSFMTAVLSFLDKKKRDICLVLLLIIYAVFNLSNHVALKLCITLSLFILFKLRYGHVYYFDVIGAVAIIIGLFNPLVYFDAGFAMSMLSSILIYYFYDSAERHVKFIKPKYIRRLVTIGIICGAGLIPIAAYFFGHVTLHSIFVSFIMLPCVTVILILSPLTLTLIALISAAPVAGWITSAMVFVLKYVPILADKAKFLGHETGKTHILELLIYLFIMIALVKLVKRKKTHMLAALFVAATLCASAGINELTRLNNIELTFVNVGQGDGAVITAPHRFNILIDGGGGNAYSDYNPGERLFLEYLKTEGITEVDSAFVSHYHKDHAQGIVAAIENIRVKNLFMPDNMEGSEWRERLENAAAENGTKIHYLTDEILLRYKNGMTIQVIPPAPKTTRSSDENDTTYVYYVSYGDFSAMYTGDMSRYAERNLLELGRIPQADLLKVAHHGSASATCREWVEAVKPKYSVISVGENNTYYLPSDEVLENLNGTTVYRTDYDGDVRVIAEKDGVKKIDIFDRRRY